MLNFVPPNTIDFEQLWALISTRNRWFVNIRYYIIAALSLFFIFMQYVFKINFTETQLWAFAIITSSLFLINIVYSYVINSGIIKDDEVGFNQLHFSFNQIIIDFLFIESK